ncbi:DNA-binding response regulator [Cupriavidus sp. USMAA2-4]|uniref:DNA-binding response regulator n=1 Tax=Cupriavidus malaysiensis TaxID=367825 RepID=A0ABN4TQI4_9BURK|nr:MULTISPECIES: response regulator [Cupriavidus]AOY96508.1 DNA-binding response regulator [Cupriavidus sp. USMAA2-4]AOZ03089.1 DNA-binding response regulator [Cupriavidus sp. USMAHM13]AOZ09547.1 DNA-binding response regulator [Cupriavidus malaysiensis]
MTRALIVEDDLKLARLIAQYLGQHGFLVTQVHRGDAVLAAVRASAPDIVVLDQMLPGRDGMQVCRDLRAVSPVPVLMLSARGENVDVILGLEAGADDYVAKPVEPRVLLARMRALLRRPVQWLAEVPRLAFDALEIERSSRTVVLEGRPVDVTTMEFEMLWALASRAGTVLTRDDLLNAVRGVDFNGLDRSVDVCIGRLRRKLNDNPRDPARIKTVWGRGYLFARAREQRSAPC